VRALLFGFPAEIQGTETLNLKPETNIGDVAQLGEHSLCKAGVAGSIPVVSIRGHLRRIGASGFFVCIL
jgi:hypothetical protein